MSADFPVEARRFILDNLSSVEQLEALLLIRTDPTKDWTAEDLSKVLYSTPSAVQMRMDDLVARGLVLSATESPKAYRYEPKAERDQLLEMLAELYRERRVAVIGLIYSKQGSQVQAFADAFRFRKD